VRQALVGEQPREALPHRCVSGQRGPAHVVRTHAWIAASTSDCTAASGWLASITCHAAGAAAAWA
jgi:hypothetical protein